MKSELNREIAQAFATDLKDAVKPFKATRTTIEGTDFITNTPLTTTINYSGKGVFGSYSAREIDGDTILATDRKLTCLQSQVKQIQVDDYIDGYQVVSVSHDPVDVIWVAQLRKV